MAEDEHIDTFHINDDDPVEQDIKVKIAVVNESEDEDDEEPASAPAETDGELDGHESEGKEDKRSRGARTRAKVLTPSSHCISSC